MTFSNQVLVSSFDKFGQTTSNVNASAVVTSNTNQTSNLKKGISTAGISNPNILKNATPPMEQIQGSKTPPENTMAEKLLITNSVDEMPIKTEYELAAVESTNST